MKKDMALNTIKLPVGAGAELVRFEHNGKDLLRPREISRLPPAHRVPFQHTAEPEPGTRLALRFPDGNTFCAWRTVIWICACPMI